MKKILLKVSNGVLEEWNNNINSKKTTDEMHDISNAFCMYLLESINKDKKSVTIQFNNKERNKKVTIWREQ